MVGKLEKLAEKERNEEVQMGKRAEIIQSEEEISDVEFKPRVTFRLRKMKSWPERLPKRWRWIGKNWRSLNTHQLFSQEDKCTSFRVSHILDQL